MVLVRPRARSTIKTGSENNFCFHSHFTEHMVYVFRKLSRENDLDHESSRLLIRWLKSTAGIQPANNSHQIGWDKSEQGRKSIGAEVLCSSKKQCRRPEPRGARLACSTGEKAGLNYTTDSRSNIRGARSQRKREVAGRRKISLRLCSHNPRLCSQNPKQQKPCSTTEARKNGFRLSESLCACSKQRLNNERPGAQNHHQTDVPKGKAGSRICETKNMKQAREPDKEPGREHSARNKTRRNQIHRRLLLWNRMKTRRETPAKVRSKSTVACPTEDCLDPRHQGRKKQN
jgi:hypothetical protein